MKHGRWYTCTPVAFKGDDTFFNRDSGLFCKAFQEIGIESKAVMPLPAQDGDWPDLIRTDYKNLESSDWWRSQNIDGVVLYAWTKTRYTPIARAIHNSGAKLVLYMDVGALTYPWKDWLFGTKLLFRAQKLKHPHSYIPRAIFEIIRAHTLTPANYIRRRNHLEYADLIGFPSPPAIEAYKRIPLLMSKKSRRAITLTPAPVASHFKYDPQIPKQDRIIAVGRWDDEETKRPRFLMKALEIFCQHNGTFQIDIFGSTPDFIKQWHSQLPNTTQSRIHLHGVVKSIELINWYQKAKLCLCTSIREGAHIVSEEAVCCGCSVVTSPSPGLQTVQWYASENSGTIATNDTAKSFFHAILKEVNAWSNNDRNPQQISKHWCPILHASETATKITEFFKREENK